MKKLLLAGALALVACGTHVSVPTKGGIALPFIENDYTGALTKAREAKLPIFVEVWAPW
jgi:hypothetical protein